MSNHGQFTRIDEEETILHRNVNQDFIVITEDKLRLILRGHIDGLVEKKGWIAPLSIATTITLTFVTTDFKQAGFDAATWTAFFLISLLISIGWLIYSLYQHSNADDFETLIKKIKKSEKSS